MNRGFGCNSFSLKIALLCGTMAGLLLAGAGVLLWRMSYRLQLDRLDREIRNIGQANLERVQGGDHWSRLEDALQFVAGDRKSTAFRLWVNHNGKVIYRSPEWPASIHPEELKPLAGYEGNHALKPGDEPPPPPRRGEALSPANPPLPLRVPSFQTFELGAKRWRVGAMGNPYVTLVVAAELDELESGLVKLREVYFSALTVVVLLVTGGSWMIARGVLNPVRTLTQTAQSITAQGLGTRIPVRSGDAELNRLITVFNEMLDRLEGSFAQATRFSADASHELKTPLARLQAEIEQAIEASSGNPETQEIFGSLLEETSRLKAITQKLLLLSRADAGQLQIVREPVNLSVVLADVVEDARLRAPGLRIEESVPAGVQVQADRDLLEQALQNLVDNAIKYNESGGWIRIELAVNGEGVECQVSNSGSAIPEAAQDQLFRRFYRGDESRSARVEGTGLGLSIAREIVHAHGGKLWLVRSDAEGTTFVFSLLA